MIKVEQFVKTASKLRKNRCDYQKCFNVLNLYEGGVVQLDEKSKYDRVIVDENENESVLLYGLDSSDGSYFEVDLKIFSLYPSPKDQRESDFRLAKVRFDYSDNAGNFSYRYEKEQLINYSERRSSRQSNESKNVYRIGSLSFEIVSPFGMSRILFNGLMSRTPSSAEGVAAPEELVSCKLTISTHPTSDKFDYQYRFDERFLMKQLKNETFKNEQEVKTALNLLLENRIDQPLMFQGRLELLSEDSATMEPTKFIMWGGKIKRFLNETNKLLMMDKKEIEANHSSSEILLAWAESGHQMHLSKSIKFPNLISGFVNASFEYPGHLHAASLSRKDQLFKFSDLESFSDLSEGHKITVKAFIKKEFNLEICEQLIKDKLFKVKINNFDGIGMILRDDCSLAEEFLKMQSKLWTQNIHDLEIGSKFATEKLLGGKGNSLIDLNKFLSMNAFFKVVKEDISVPRGLVVTCLAYELWLKSNPLILSSIETLDRVRKSLSARSFYTNPMSDKHFTLAQSQQILRDQCEKTSLLLKSCPLPNSLKKHLHSELSKIFTKEDLTFKEENGKLFAIRSSAVGEDSMETSAAGQMKTILDSCGFESICISIVDCWISQFGMEAVIYKTQNGLEFNLPMAVVIQELIPCYAAGVAATCNAITGDKKSLEITANLGLGEGVVSGRQTDSMKINLSSLREWNPVTEELEVYLTAESRAFITKVSDSGKDAEICLGDEQIIALANLLLKLRQLSAVKEREVEWGITQDDSSGGGFRIHLLQSRPLTNLSRLSSREISHELDYGFGCPLEVCSRANLGEVMPGALSPMNVSWYIPLCTNCIREKPFEPFHTSKIFAANSFGFFGQIASMVLTNTDSISRFMSPETEANEESKALMKTMIGVTGEFAEEKMDRLKGERINPITKLKRYSISRILSWDAGIMHIYMHEAKRKFRNSCLLKNLAPIDSLIERMEATDSKLDKATIKNEIKSDIKALFHRLCTDLWPLQFMWINHISGTIMSMTFNIMSMKILANQTNYPSILDSSEILNDFSILIRGGAKTESGDTSKLLNDLIECMAKGGQSSDKEANLAQFRAMTSKELYEHLSTSQKDYAKMYRKFMDKNGHRAFKEFDFATKTWSDDPSYIIRSLAARLKQYNIKNSEEKRLQIEKKDKEEEEKRREILNRVSDAIKPILVGYALPRARTAVARREKTKSDLIKMIHVYRCAFRHLAALLCLDGRMPNVDLIYQITMEELELIVKVGDEATPSSQADLAKILYKARRRQQRSRLLDQVNFPEPVMDFRSMVKLVNSVIDEDKPALPQQVPSSSNGLTSADDIDSVRGMTSCAGIVTGRALVVSSLDDMDQVETNDILVTYSIDISWSVYFFALSGIVTEVGGIVSHGAVIAREYGIPTLCTALGVCSKFKTGQMITLDCNQGICYLAKDQAEAGGH